MLGFVTKILENEDTCLDRLVDDIHFMESFKLVHKKAFGYLNELKIQLAEVQR